MPDKTWKAAERRIAGLLGGRRIPVTGRARGEAPDIDHPWLSIEVKHRAHLPGWIVQAMLQAAAAAGVDQLPIVVLHQAGQPYRGSVVMVRLEDWIDWFGAEADSLEEPTLSEEKGAKHANDVATEAGKFVECPDFR